MTDPLFTKLLIVTLTLSLCITLVFTVWPGLDLLVSGALINDQNQFVAVTLGFPAKMNSVVRRTLELAAFGSLFYTIWLWLARRADKAWLTCWSFITLNMLIGPGVIVNMVLKEHVGRARPVDVTQFGGPAEFSAAFKITDQCASNCSFTSGEAALVATWVFVVLGLLWGHLGAQARVRAVAYGAGLMVVGAGLRVVLGQHFLSDVLVSSLISALVALALYRLLDVPAARSAFAPARFGALLRSRSGRVR